MQEREIWVVWTNTDLTEGRGTEYALHYCELEATARRLAKGGYVQGCDCRITKKKMFLHENMWYAPGPHITPPSDTDRQVEQQLEVERTKQARRDQAIARARELGLSDEDLEILKG